MIDYKSVYTRMLFANELSSRKIICTLSQSITRSISFDYARNIARIHDEQKINLHINPSS